MSRNKNIEFVLIACLTFAVALAAQSKADNLYYQVFRSQSEDPATAEVIGSRVSDTHFTDTNVVEGVRYYYWVKATSMVADFDVISHPVLAGDPEVYPHYKSTLYLLVADKTKVGQLTPLIIMHEMENLTQDIHSIDFDYYFYRTDSGTEQLDHVIINDITIQPANTYYEELNFFYIISEYDTEPATFQGSVRWQYDAYNHHYDFTQLTPEINSELVYVLPTGPTVTTQPTENTIELTWTAKTETTDRSETALGRIPTTIYVNHAGTPDPEDGKTWETAYIFLQDALQQAEYGDTVCVAAPALGNQYHPDVSSATPTGSHDRTASFLIPNGVKVYGGFPTHGSDLSQRDPDVYPTVLSGDINARENIGDNSYHVVTITDCDATTSLDGFVIESGNANILDPHDRGAGLFVENSEAVIQNCTIRYNAAIMAAGIYCKQANPAILNCLFWDNNAGAFGGAGMYNQDSTPTVQNCRFILNTAHTDIGGNGGNGGAIYNESSDPVMTNCEFKCNTAKKNGGGVYNWDSEPEFINCTFSGNIADVNGGGMCNSDIPGYFSLAQIENCIFWGNWDGNVVLNEYTQIAGYQPVIYNSCIQDETPDDGSLPFSGSVYDNIDSNPEFVTDPNPGTDGQWDGVDDCIGNLKLQYSSPCIETGSNSYLTADVFDMDDDGDKAELIPFDAAGHLRLLDNDKNFTATVDMGAYERGVCPGNPDFDRSGHVNLKDFAMLAERWLDMGCDCYDDCCGQRDLNGDGQVAAEDLAILSEHWLSGFSMFADNFESGGLELWDIEDGTWTIENGKLKGKGAGGGVDAWIYAGDVSWIDYSVEADVEMTSGNCEIVLRSTGHWENEYRIEIFKYNHGQYPNDYHIGKYQNTVHSTLKSGDAGGIMQIPQNCRIKVSVIGNEIALYIDDTFIDSVVDPNTLVSGRFGLGVIWSYTCYFDNVLVKELENPDVLYNPGNGHYYEVVGNSLTWQQAKTAAESRIHKGMRGHLATVTSESENTFIMDNVADNQGAYFLGGYQPDGSPEPDGNWQWVTGEVWDWHNWNSGEPNNGNGGTHEEYLIVYADTYNWWGKWGDAPNSTTLHYIVEYD